MRRIARIPFVLVIASVAAAAAAAGCSRQETGAHVYVRLGQLQFDELRLGVTQTATGETVVDPATAGRYQGPFQPGDQDAIIYLADTLDGTSCGARRPHCWPAVRSAPAPPTCSSRAAR
jgi:hypothetical protein